MKNNLLTFLLMISLGLNPGIVLAQQKASSPAELSFPLTETKPQTQLNEDVITDALQSLSETPEAALSVSQKPLPRLLPLHHQVFKSTEHISFLVENAREEDLTIELFDKDGEQPTVTITSKQVAENLSFSITPPATLKPGKFTLKVTDSQGNSSEEELFWGILAINTNKSLYQPNESAKLHVLALDEQGKITCDSLLELTIRTPQKEEKKYLSTDYSKKETCTTPETNKTNFTITYPVGAEEGAYEMTLTAHDNDKTYTITDTFHVKKDLPFVIERVGETQITPFIQQTMLLHVEVLEDFRGEISEVVPEEFEIGSLDNFPDFRIKTKPIEPLPEIAQHISFDPPFDGLYTMTQGFGVEETDPLMAFKYRFYGLIGHDGVDYAMPQRTPIFSVDDGIVVLTEKFGDYGTTVVVRHRWGTSYYGHLSKIVKNKGDLVKKGEQIALSGDTGLSTGPHLHFGIKLRQHDDANGYYGKTDPFPYMTTSNPLFAEVKGITIERVSDLTIPPGFQMLTWDVNLKKGDKIQLGYTYTTTAEDEQIYLIEPLTFHELITANESQVADTHQEATSETASSLIPRTNELLFQEERTWQVNVDYTDHGTMTVSPDKSRTGASNQQYTFTYTTGGSANNGSGLVAIQIPQNWPAPQTTSLSRAGKTTVDKDSTGIIGDLLHTMDVLSDWKTNHACSQGLFINKTSVAEGTGSLTCIHGKEKYGSWYFSIPQSDWTSYTTVGLWVKSSAPLKHGQLQFAYDNTDGLSSPLETIDIPEITADKWTWVTITLNPNVSRTKIINYGFRASNASSLEDTTISIDYVLIGPGTPVIEGTGPWTILLPILSMPANDGKILVNYGGGTPLDGVSNPSTSGITQFNTKVKMTTQSSQKFVSLPEQPTITLLPSPRDNPFNSLWISPEKRTPFSL